LDPAKPLRHDAITNDISRDDLASSPARATFSPMADDNYFSPLSSHMDREDLGITRGRVIANRLEPYDFCDEENMYKETSVNNEDVAGVFACEEDHRSFIHSPIGTITVNGGNRGAALTSPRLITTSAPQAPGRAQSSMHSTPPPPSKRIRFGGSPAGKERSPRVSKVVVSRYVQTNEVYRRNVGTQASLSRTPRILGALVKDRWASRKRKVVEKFISDNIVGGSSWMNGGDGIMHVHAVLSKLFNKHPKLLSGVVTDIGDTHKAFKDLKAGVEADMCMELQEHLDSIAGPLYALLNLTETGYQKLINSLSWKYDHEQARKTPAHPV